MAKMLDASAILAFIRQEPGHLVVRACLERQARACAVNISEVMAVLVGRGLSREDAGGLLTNLPLDIVAFDEAMAIEAGDLIRHTGPFGLSFGDRACLAAGLRDGDTVVTADQAWVRLAPIIGITVEVIRPPGA